jgi:hypothetical protein
LKKTEELKDFKNSQMEKFYDIVISINSIKDINKGITGEVVGFCYGGSYILKNKDYTIISEIISEYENKKYN